MKKMCRSNGFPALFFIIAMIGFGCDDDSAQQNTNAITTVEPPTQSQLEAYTNSLRTKSDLTTAELCTLYNLPLPTDSNGNPVEAWGPNKGQVITKTAKQLPQGKPIAANEDHPQQLELTQADREYLIKQGLDPDKAVLADGQQQPQVSGIAYMDSFLGETNFYIPSNFVISMKTESLKFLLYGKTYDYSGHYAVMLNVPRKHNNPLFGFGTPEKAKLVLIEDFGGEAMPLSDATIWEKSNGFIDVEAVGKEWIYSGTYTIQN